MENSTYIKEIEKWVKSEQIPDCSDFRILSSENECFNQYGLCGIVMSGEGYIWCYQATPACGDRPHSYFETRTFNTLAELYDYVKTKRRNPC